MVGIYLIKNIITKKVYVGCSLNIKDRWKSHRVSLKRKKHHSIHLQRAWNKYGENCFIFGVLEFCEKEDLQKMEQYYLDFYKSYENNKGYNILKFSDNVLATSELFKNKPKTKEHNLKNSEAHKGNKNGMFGKVFTDEEKLEKSIIAKKNFKNNPMYKEVKFKAPCGTTFIINNQSVFSKKLNIHPSALTDVTKGRSKTAKGWSKG